MKKLLGALVSIYLISCSSGRITGSDNRKIDITFIQVNDVYEIAPLEGGRTGGFARIAHLKKKYKAENPNTLLVMAGDFLSPSVYNSLQFEGKRIRGRQMVETMNTAGMDIAVFGNHEFDISETELQNRLNESDFLWISSNSFQKKGADTSAFKKIRNGKTEPVPETYILNVTDADGTTARIGFFGINIPYNKAAYVIYTDPLATAVKMYNQLKDSCDAVIAITHQQMKDDVLLAERIPGLAMIIGGHEHDSRYQKVGNVIIAKAHANAKSAYVLNLRINKKANTFSVNNKLEMINASIPSDPATDSVVQKWTKIADNSYSALGFNATRVIRTKGEPLEGREGEIRHQPTNLSRIIVSSMQAAAPEANIAILNAGSVRLDDVLQMPVSEYDILRTLPFGGSIVEVDMKGSLLLQLLEAGRLNKGSGGFLHYSSSVNYDSVSNSWNYQKGPFNPDHVYRIALTDFLITGGEANMGFLKKDNPSIIKIYPVATTLSDPRSDIRLAVIKYMSTQEGN